MFEYIYGEVTLITANYIVIENNNIGYQILTPNPYSFKVNTLEKVFIYTHIRENIFALYGFKTLEERKLFLDIISVKGVGPKGGLAILAGGNLELIIQAIQEGNAKYLQKFPGIGPKVSQQIILDLSGKMSLTSTNIYDEKITNVITALESLGYQQREIKKVIPIMIDKNYLSIEELIKLCLRKI